MKNIKYDLSKMIYVEKSPSGFSVRMTTVDGQDVSAGFYFADRNSNLSEFNAKTHAQHLMNNILDIIKKVSGEKLPDYEVKIIEEI